MIRPAKSTDAFAIVDVIEERYPETRYAGSVAIEAKVARSIMAQAVQRHGGTTEGSTFLMVSENGEGVIEAFVLGSLARVYMIGDKLAAADNFILGRRSCDPRVMKQLIDAYVAWASENPRVYEISLSWSDAFDGTGTMNKVYERRGFELCGTTYRMLNPNFAEKQEAGE